MESINIFQVKKGCYDILPWLRGSWDQNKRNHTGVVKLRLRWLNTVFDTCVSFTVLSKTLDPSIAKNGGNPVNNRNFGFWMVELTYVLLP